MGCFTTCLRLKRPHKGKMGHRLKSPINKIPAWGYLASAKSNLDDRCSIIELRSFDGGWYKTLTIKQEIPRGSLWGLIYSHKVSKLSSCSSSRVLNGRLDLIKLQTPPPILKSRSRRVNAYPSICKAESLIWWDNHVSVIKAQATWFDLKTTAKSSTLGRSDLTFDDRKMGDWICRFLGIMTLLPPFVVGGRDF